MEFNYNCKKFYSAGPMVSVLKNEPYLLLRVAQNGATTHSIMALRIMFFVILSMTTICNEFHSAQCRYAECRVSFIVMLNAIILSVVMLNVVMPSVVAPAKQATMTLVLL